MPSSGSTTMSTSGCRCRPARRCGASAPRPSRPRRSPRCRPCGRKPRACRRPPPGRPTPCPLPDQPGGRTGRRLGHAYELERGCDRQEHRSPLPSRSKSIRGEPIGMPACPRLRWSLTLPFADVPLAAHEPLVRRAEAAGYDDLWTGETNGPDGFTPLVLAAAGLRACASDGCRQPVRVGCRSSPSARGGAGRRQRRALRARPQVVDPT